jgi:hypothetical protein
MWPSHVGTYARSCWNVGTSARLCVSGTLSLKRRSW